MRDHNNELHKHKAADTIKWIVAFVLIIAIIGAVICLALQVGGVYDFLNKFKTPEDKQNDSEDVNGELSIEHGNIKNFVDNKYKLTSVAMPMSASNTSSYRLTVTTDTGEHVNLVWSVAFANPTSAWANEKQVSDYIKITPVEQKMACTVTCLKPFGEQVVVGVHADFDDRVNASATFDYKCDYSISNISCEQKTDDTSTLRLHIEKTVGTIDDYPQLKFDMSWDGWLTDLMDTKYLKDNRSISQTVDINSEVTIDIPGMVRFNGNTSIATYNSSVQVSFCPTWKTDYASIEAAMLKLFISDDYLNMYADSYWSTVGSLNAEFNRGFTPTVGKFRMTFKTVVGDLLWDGYGKGFNIVNAVSIENIPSVDGQTGTFFRTDYASDLSLNSISYVF